MRNLSLMTTQESAPHSLAEIGVSRAEACQRLGVHPETLRRYCRDGLLDRVRVGPKRVLITWSSLERMLRGGE